MFSASGPGVTTIQIPGYMDGLQTGVPVINNMGAKASAGISNQAIGSIDVQMAISGLLITILIVYLVLKYFVE